MEREYREVGTMNQDIYQILQSMQTYIYNQDKVNTRSAKKNSVIRGSGIRNSEIDLLFKLNAWNINLIN